MELILRIIINAVVIGITAWPRLDLTFTGSIFNLLVVV